MLEGKDNSLAVKSKKEGKRLKVKGERLENFLRSPFTLRLSPKYALKGKDVKGERLENSLQLPFTLYL